VSAVQHPMLSERSSRFFKNCSLKAMKDGIIFLGRTNGGVCSAGLDISAISWNC
jgi:hypothetical protein